MKAITAAEYRALQKKPRKPMRQIEGAAQRTFGQLLNFSYKPRLSPNLAFWSYSGSGERKSLKTGILQKRKGLMRGAPDYFFNIVENGKLHVIYIEFKTSTGSLTPEQKEFFKRHEGLENAKCYLARSPEEAIEICFKERILI